MRLVWNGRSYRPVTNFIKVEKDDINELMKPLSQKTKLGSAVLTGYVINAKPNPEGGTTPVVSPTPSVTPTFTPTQTQTNTPTPSSTPFPLPSTPDLWYDSTNLGSIDYITSGGTDYVSAWRSIGNYSKTLTGTTTDTMPTWSASTMFPGNPKIIKFNKSATVGLRDVLSQRFDSTVITGAGVTAFYVIAKPTEYNYSSVTTTNGFGVQFYMYSGNTTNGGFTPVTGQPPRVFNAGFGNGANSTTFQLTSSGVTNAYTFSYSATNLNDKFLFTLAAPFPTGNQYIEINQSGATNTTAITGTPVTTYNSFIIGASPSSGGTLTTQNAGAEVAEIMIYTRELTVQEQEAVQNYLRDKWRYDEWASPVPTPTQTGTPTNTPTPSISPTQTSSPTVTPTPSTTPPIFSPSGVTNLQHWYMADSGATVSSWTNYGLLGGSVTQGVGANQPQIVSGATLGSYTGVAVQFDNQRDFYTGNTSSINTNDHTSYLVYKPFSSSISGWAIILKSASTYTWFYQNYSSANSGVTRSYVGQYQTFRNTGAQLIISSGDSSSITATRNDVLGVSGSTTAGSATTSNAIEFGYDAGSTISQGIQVFEWVFYNKKLSDTEHTNVINYLKTKYQYNTW